MITEALNYKRRQGSNTNIKYIARIPGQEILIISAAWDRETEDLEKLISENIDIINSDDENVVNLVRDITRVETESRTWALSSDENAEEIYFIVVNKESKESKWILAQQIVDIPVIPVTWH